MTQQHGVAGFPQIFRGALLLCAFLLTPLYLIYKPPAILIRWCQRKWPDVLWNVETKEKVIALTIDDGPSEYTREILDVLQTYGASATFFIIGSYVELHRGSGSGILEDIIRAGCELGNHTMYDAPSWNLSDAELKSQIGEVEDLIDAAYRRCGRECPARYFRPGSGWFSTRMRKLVGDELGYRLVLGNVFPFDPQIPFWEVNAWHVLGMVREGGIVVCHDGRERTVPMLKRVLEEMMRRRGYRVVRLTDLLES